MITEYEKQIRNKAWLRAKAEAQLDGLLLPSVFIEKVEEYLADEITWQEVLDFYETLLPDEATYKEMWTNWESEYCLTTSHEELERVLEEIRIERLTGRITPKKENPITWNGLTLDNVRGMGVAIAVFERDYIKCQWRLKNVNFLHFITGDDNTLLGILL